MKLKKESLSIPGRLVISVFTMVISFITGVILWLIPVGLNGYVAHFGVPPFWPVLGFVILMTLICMVTGVNLITEIFGHIWRFIYKVISSASQPYLLEVLVWFSLYISAHNLVYW